MESLSYIRRKPRYSWIRRLLAVILLLAAPHTCCWSQSLIGKVKGQGEGLLMGASVVATNANGRTVAFSVTNESGAFQLVIPEGSHPAQVTVSYLGFESRTIPFAQVKNNDTITLAQSDFQLREVKVTTQRLKKDGDTLTYSVAGFRQAQDRSIADVISKMPGMEVKADGKIEYQGRAINKFYIEGLDLMGGRYGVASNNLSADKVASVEVIQNHQPVKSLRGVTFSDQAAVNIVLRDEVRTTWNASADFGLGYGDETLYDSRVMAMSFNKAFQSLMMYKNNDTGRDIAIEVRDLTSTSSGNSVAESGIVALPAVSSPQLNRERYTFNHSHLVAGNWLWKVGDDKELRIQGNGLMDKTVMQSQSQVTYLTLADLPIIVEERSITNTRSEWNGEATYQCNADKFYIQNKVRGQIDFNKSHGWTMLDGNYTDMLASPRKRSFSERFFLSHTTSKKNVFEAESSISYNFMPEQLLTLNGATECLDLKFLSIQNSVKSMLRMGRHYLSNQLGVNYQSQRIGVFMPDDVDEHHTYRLLQSYWMPSLSLLLRNHQVDASFRLSYAQQDYHSSHLKEVWVEPQVRWRWQLSPTFEIRTNVNYGANPSTGTAIFDTPIFTNYQTRRVGNGEAYTLHTLSAGMAFLYTNPIKAVFLNVQPVFSVTTGNQLYQGSFTDGIYTLAATDQHSVTTTRGGALRLSKSFGWAKSVYGLSTQYSVSDYNILLNGLVDDARMRLLGATIDYSLRPVRLLSIEGKSGVQIHRQQNLSHPQVSASGSVTNWEHQLNMFVFPTDKWMITLGNELFHSSDRDYGVNYFCDLSVSCKTKRWELSLTANNIIGTSVFEHRMLSNTIETYSVTHLRPREILIKYCFDF